MHCTTQHYTCGPLHDPPARPRGARAAPFKPPVAGTATAVQTGPRCGGSTPLLGGAPTRPRSRPSWGHVAPAPPASPSWADRLGHPSWVAYALASRPHATRITGRPGGVGGKGDAVERRSGQNGHGASSSALLPRDCSPPTLGVRLCVLCSSLHACTVQHSTIRLEPLPDPPARPRGAALPVLCCPMQEPLTRLQGPR